LGAKNEPEAPFIQQKSIAQDREERSGASCAAHAQAQAKLGYAVSPQKRARKTSPLIIQNI